MASSSRIVETEGPISLGKNPDIIEVGSSSRANSRIVQERSPSRQFIRYNKIIGKGTSKVIFEGLDTLNGILVAWNKIMVTNVDLKKKGSVENCCGEPKLLQTLDHENIIKCYCFWISKDRTFINMITDLASSKSLSNYRRSHELVGNVTAMSAIKGWCRQILSASEYLHNRTPVIIHRDVKGENILIDGVSGKIKLADFGVAVPFAGETDDVAGTLSYMSAEDLNGEQSEKSDIYAFGMCLLQMMTKDPVYSECRSEYELLGKIKSGVKPADLYLVQDKMVKKFIEKCLAKASKRPSATDLLKHPFLAETTKPAWLRSLRKLSLTRRSSS
ncbi:probable serine/threonine-protein kinase WNK9 [Chenopodium quinoa]|uniref:non-specific serine/threonine protein kinase n=1 Tax=Chenopodium quinoa TaxID=63459 RepID=A0A803MTB4_CHEQI|nr:probable serine/threonine-protein kinase WNK9 [Chenopodium quinoa]